MNGEGRGFYRMRKNSSGLSFRGATSDAESRRSGVFRARLLALRPKAFGLPYDSRRQGDGSLRSE